MFRRVTSHTNADDRWCATWRWITTRVQTRARVPVELGRDDGLDSGGLPRFRSSVSRSERPNQYDRI